MSNNDNKIAIVVPVYNVEKYIRTFVDSLKSQTNQRFNVYFVDDCSSDGSYEYIKNNLSENWILIQNENRMGAAFSRNRAIETSTEEYIHCLDADDYIENTLIEELYLCIDKSNPDIIMLERDYFNDGEEIIRYYSFRKMYPDNWYNSHTIDYCLPARAKIGTTDVCISRTLLDRFNIRFQNLSSSNDVFYILFSMLMADSIVHVPTYNSLYHTRNHSSIHRISNHRDPMNAYLALKKVKEELLKYNKLEEVGVWFWEYCLMSLQDQLNKCNDDKRKREVYKYLIDCGLRELGVGSQLFEEKMPVAFKNQYNKFIEMDITDIDCSYSLFMEGLCIYNENKIIEYVNRIKGENKILGFWGLGGFSKGFIETVNKHGLHIDYFFDSNIDSGKKYNIEVSEFTLHSENVDVIIVSSTRYFSQIADKILKHHPKTEVVCMEDILYAG